MKELLQLIKCEFTEDAGLADIRVTSLVAVTTLFEL